MEGGKNNAGHITEPKGKFGSMRMTDFCTRRRPPKNNDTGPTSIESSGSGCCQSTVGELSIFGEGLVHSKIFRHEKR